MKGCWISVIMREKQMKTTVSYPYTPIRMAKTKPSVKNEAEDWVTHVLLVGT
jgi:hypothetical protein